MMLGHTEVSFVADTEIRGRLEDFFPGVISEDEVVARVGSFLIRTSERIILVDLGLGPGGWLLDNLGRHGVTPGDVDLVVFTHLHRDHVGWAGAFPNARYLADPGEQASWRDEIGGLDALPAGLEAVPSPGHTPGHTCLLITDPGTTARVLLLGDLLHVPAQLDHPDWSFRSDAEPERARRSRRDVLARFGGDGRTVLLAAHFADEIRVRPRR